MTIYTLQKISLTPHQKAKFQKHYEAKMPLKLKLKHAQLEGKNDDVFLTSRQINHLKKAKDNKKGAEIDFSHAQIVKQRGGFLGALIPMAKTMAMPLAKKVASPILTGTLSGLMSSLMSSITGKGLFTIPQSKIDRLIKYKEYLTKAQKEQIVTALAENKGVALEPTKKQQGGLLPLLAGIATSLLLPKLLAGKGIMIDSTQKGKRKIFIPKQQKKGSGGDVDKCLEKIRGGFVFPKHLQKQFDKAFLKKGEGLLLGPDSPLKNIPLIGDIF